VDRDRGLVVVRGGDDGDLSVDNDQPAEELVEGAHLRTTRDDVGDVLAGGRAVSGRVLVERPHAHAAFERLDVAVLRDGQEVRWATPVRLGGQQLVAAVGDGGVDEVVDVLDSVDLEDRPHRGVRRGPEHLAEVGERVRPAGRLVDQVGAAPTEWHHDL